MPENQWETPRRSSWIRCRVISGLLSAFLLSGVFRMRATQFIEGKILFPLVRFALPVLLALFLQAMYGAVDLWTLGALGVRPMSPPSRRAADHADGDGHCDSTGDGITILTGSRRSGSRSRRKPAAFLWEESFCLLHRCGRGPPRTQHQG